MREREGQFAYTRTEAQKRNMAALIWELKKQFQKARILGHRDLPGVRKECPCHDVRADQNTGKSFQNLNDMPEISGTTMQGGENFAPDPGQTIAGDAPA